jgi:hypothetical protein
LLGLHSGAYDWSEYSLYWGEACVSGTALTRHTSSVLTTTRRPGRKLYELIGHDQLKKTLDDLRTDMESSSGGSGVAVIDALFREGEDAPLFAVLQTIAGLDHASVDQLLSPHLFSGGNADGTGSSTQVRKCHFLRHLYINAIILPRQARDKHRENSKKGRFLAGEW